MRIAEVVGRAILPAAGFQAALSGRVRVFTPDERRLKAGGSQDWLPHNSSRCDGERA
jgi:hypothetical protein